MAQKSLGLDRIRKHPANGIIPRGEGAGYAGLSGLAIETEMQNRESAWERGVTATRNAMLRNSCEQGISPDAPGCYLE